MKDSTKVAKIVLAHKVNKRNGQEYHEFVGGVSGDREGILVSVSCGSDGRIKVYETKDGKPIIYARIIRYDASKAKTKQNFFSR